MQDLGRYVPGRISTPLMIGGGTLGAAVLLAVGEGHYPHVHTILDTGVFLLSAVVGWVFWNMGRTIKGGFASWVSVCFLIASALGGVHVLVEVEWSGVLDFIRAYATSLRPALWPPPSYVLPIGVAVGAWSYPRRQTSPAALALVLCLISVGLVWIFLVVEPYSAPGLLGITRPRLTGIPLAWLLAGVMCWSRRREDRVLEAMVPPSVILFFSHGVMLYSRSPADTRAMISHLGIVAGYLWLLMSVTRMGLSDWLDRARIAATLTDVNADLERRVAERTAALQTANSALESTNRALMMLSLCNEALVRASDEATLNARICEIAVNVGGYQIARVSYLHTPHIPDVSLQANAGGALPFEDAMRQFWLTSPGLNGEPVGMPALRGEVCVAENLAEDPSLSAVAEQLRRSALTRGILLPLKDGNEVYGVMSLYSSSPGIVSRDEIDRLTELASDLSFGLCTLRAADGKRKAEQKLLASIKERDGLLQEIHHRVKNNLQVIVSLIRLESRRMPSSASKESFGRLQARILTMALLHERLYRSRNFASIDIAAYLKDLAERLGGAFAIRPDHVSFKLDLTPVSLELEQAAPFGLLVSELVSNAVKHAFADGRKGIITISLKVDESGLVLLRVSNNGVPLPNDFETRRATSLGLQLVGDLAQQVGGRLNITSTPDGPTFGVDFHPRAAKPSKDALDQTSS